MDVLYLVECRVSKYRYDLSFESSDGMSARRKNGLGCSSQLLVICQRDPAIAASADCFCLMRSLLNRCF